MKLLGDIFGSKTHMPTTLNNPFAFDKVENIWIHMRKNLFSEEFILASSRHPYIGKYVRVGGELNGVYGYIVDVEEVFDEDFDCTKMIIHIKNENDGFITKHDKDDAVELVPQVEYIEKALD